MSVKVGVIIVSYNQKGFLDLLFETLSCQSIKSICIYFVDNASTDGSVEYARGLIKRLNLDARFFELAENTGYTGGNNYGVGEAVRDGCEYCLILNSDTELAPDCIEILIECIESTTGIAATGPILLLGKKDDQNTYIQELGAVANFSNYIINKNYSSESYEQTKEKIPDYLMVNFLTGACILIKSAVYKEIGLFDARYFAYGEEIDLFKRINEAGFKVLASKNARVWHHHDWSGKNKKGYYREYYLIQRNKYLYFKKHHLHKELIISMLKDITHSPLTLKWFIRICDFRLFIFYIKGTIAGLRNQSGNPHFK